MKKTAFIFFLLICYNSCAQIDSIEKNNMRVIFYEYIRTLPKKNILIKEFNVKKLSDFPINEDTIEKKIIFTQEKDYFVGILINYFDPVEVKSIDNKIIYEEHVHEKNHNQYVFGFSSIEKKLFFFYNNLHEIQNRIDSVTLSDLFNFELTCEIFDEKRRNIRSVELGYKDIVIKKNIVETKSIIRLEDIKKYKKYVMRHSILIPNKNLYDRQKISNTTTAIFVEFLKIIGEDIGYTGSWAREKKSITNYYERQINGK